MKCEQLLKSGYVIECESEWNISLSKGRETVVVSKLSMDGYDFSGLNKIEIDSLSHFQKTDLAIALFAIISDNKTPQFLIDFAKNWYNRPDLDVPPGSILCPICSFETDRVYLDSWEKCNGASVNKGDVIAILRNDNNHAIELRSYGEGRIFHLVHDGNYIHHYTEMGVILRE